MLQFQQCFILLSEVHRWRWYSLLHLVACLYFYDVWVCDTVMRLSLFTLYFIQRRGTRIFQNSSSRLKILRRQKGVTKKFHTENLQVFDTTVQ